MGENLDNSEITNKFKIRPLNCILIGIILVLSIVVIILSVNLNKNKSPNQINNVYSIQYSSIEDKSTFIYVNFYVETDEEFTIYSNDFVVLINGIPVKADGMVTGYSTSISQSGANTATFIGPSLKITKSGMIKIEFKHQLSEFDSPLSFYYKGTKLDFGQKISFNI